jgi:feruloyl esterase
MFALGHPEKIVDFAYRALHETTVESKRLIRDFYNRTPQYSYYKGCSTGGRQAIMAATRFPDDYDGIIAGALANRHIHMHAAGSARQIELARHPDMAISPEKAQMVSDAVMSKCDTLHEGFLNNPRQCTFDFSTLACKGVESNECLTLSQLKAVEMFYGGVKNSRGEASSRAGAGQPADSAQQPDGQRAHGSHLGIPEPDYDWRTFDIDRDMPVIDQKIGFVDATDPDLKKFKAHGGKLLLYAGWGDTGITPKNTVEYYESVVNKMGKAETNDFTRLFMVPGMGHCRGGNGPDTFDTIGTLETWREKGTTPAAIAATNKTSGLSRPLCPYPQCEYRVGRPERRRQPACTAP